MTNQFLFIEIIMFLLPPLLIFVIRRWFKGFLQFFPEFKLTEAMILLPMWFTLIHSFSQLIFGYSIIFFVFLMAFFSVGVHLYDYIKRVKVFSMKKYFYEATKILFIFSSVMLCSMIVLRFLSYFS